MSDYKNENMQVIYELEALNQMGFSATKGYIEKLEAKVKELESQINTCLETLTEMRYFNEEHKMKKLAWNAIHSLKPELLDLSEEEAFDLIHGSKANE